MKLAALFSGGKDSTYSLYLARLAGHEVRYLVTAKARKGSYMYHVPAIEVTALIAQAMGIPQVQFRAEPEDEILPLKDALSKLDVEGVCAGAVASEYQRSRVARVCHELGLELVAPLWHADPELLMRQLASQGFELLLVGVAAMGLDEGWLGQVINEESLEPFLEVCRKNRIHPAGEGGEFETLVLAGPHIPGRIYVEFERRWFGSYGELEIRKAAFLEGKPQ